MCLSIIIVNFNVYQILKPCIESIINIVNDVEYEIIVIDNNSVNRDIENITYDFPIIKFIKSPENLGFAKANNNAVKHSNGEYLLFLNPDTIMIENFIPYFVNFLEKNKVAGALAPMLVYGDRSFQSSTGTEMNIFYDIQEAFFLTGLFRKLRNRKYIKNPDKPYNVAWASAACLLTKKQYFDEAGCFDESYFLNYEDIDLCTKIQKNGKKIFLLPGYKCIHLDHKSFDGNYELLVTSRYAGRMNYNRRYMGKIQYAASWFIQLSGLLTKLLFVGIFYKGLEKQGRKNGYLKSLKFLTAQTN